MIHFAYQRGGCRIPRALREGVICWRIRGSRVGKLQGRSSPTPTMG